MRSTARYLIFNKLRSLKIKRGAHLDLGNYLDRRAMRSKFRLINIEKDYHVRPFQKYRAAILFIQLKAKSKSSNLGNLKQSTER